jgi:mannose-1-phosphate guanylyltransferase
VRRKDIYAAVLAGGKGERLWPISRFNFPKQNLKILSKKTILQNALGRAKKIAGQNVFIITNRESYSIAKSNLKGFLNRRIVLEPFGRNTAPAIGLAALLAYKENEDSVVIAMPSDHLIFDNKKFLNVIKAATFEANKKEVIVTLGLKPTSIESAYGYIGLERRPSKISSKKSYNVAKFIEKPHPTLARRLVASKRFFWNSGIFIFKASTMLLMLKRHMPALYTGLLKLPSIKNRKRFSEALKRLYARLKSKSLDYAVLEKSRKMRVIPSDFRWSDIGSFNSISRLASKDKDGNTIFGNHVGIDAKGSIIFSNTKQLIATIGADDIIVVAASDVVLVCKRSRAQDIKKLVEKIKKRRGLIKFL